MSVHYKFKSTLDFDTITFDGLHISVGDLKRAIVLQKRLGKITDFDLQITNAQTKEVYCEDSNLIPKNTSLIIARVPLVHQHKKSYDQIESKPHMRSSAKMDTATLDIFKMKGSEEEKIEEMMLQSTVDYDPNSYVKIKGQSQTGDVPSSYRCNKCKKGGHWIKNCAFVIGKANADVKRNTGIPKSFRDKEEKSAESEIKKGDIFVVKNIQTIPEELICSICNDIYTDAVMIPCCGSSFCDDCVRTALLDSDENECPDCKEKGSSPASLIPNRFLRNSVNIFKNETGYKSTIKKSTTEVKNIDESKEELSKPIVTPNPAKGNDDDLIKSNSAANKISDNTSSVLNNTTAEMNKKSSDIHVITQTNDQPTHVPSSSDTKGTYLKAPEVEQPRNLQISSICQHPGNVSKSPQTRRCADWESNKMYGDEVKNHLNFDKIERSKFEDVVKNDLIPVSQNNSHEIFPGPTNITTVYQQIPIHTPRAEQHMLCHQPLSISFHRMFNDATPRGYAHDSIPYMVNPVPGYAQVGCQQTNTYQQQTEENLSLIYQSIVEKVGTGIIDDPLDAFNRIMKEKEKRKEEQRRSPEILRSRSKPFSGDRTSPFYQRSPRLREKRERSYKRETNLSRYGREYRRDKYYHRRSNSFNDRSPRHNKVRDGGSSQQAYNYPQDNSSSLDKYNKFESKRSYKRSISPRLETNREINSRKHSKRFQHNALDTIEPPPPGFETSSKINFNNNEEDRSIRTPPLHNYDSHLLENVSKEKKENSSKYMKLDNNSERMRHSKSPKSKSPIMKSKKIHLKSCLETNLDKKIQSDMDIVKNLEVRTSDSQGKQDHKNFAESKEEKRHNLELDSTGELSTSRRPWKESIEVESEKKCKQRKKKKKEKDDRKKIKKGKKEKKEKEKFNNVSQNQDSSVEKNSTKTDHFITDIKLDVNSTKSNSYLKDGEKRKDSRKNLNESKEHSSRNKMLLNSCIITKSSAKTNDNTESVSNPDHHNGGMLTVQSKKHNPFVSSTDLANRETMYHTSSPGSKIDRNEPSSKSDKFGNKLLNDSLRKPENAIFTRAINAIRATEVKKTTPDQQILCIETNIRASESSVNTSNSNLNSFEITVPRKNCEERCVKVKSCYKSSSDSTKTGISIKDRLGNKRHSPYKDIFSTSKKSIAIKKSGKDLHRLEKGDDTKYHRQHEEHDKYKKTSSDRSKKNVNEHFDKAKKLICPDEQNVCDFTDNITPNTGSDLKMSPANSLYEPTVIDNKKRSDKKSDEFKISKKIHTKNKKRSKSPKKKEKKYKKGF